MVAFQWLVYSFVIPWERGKSCCVAPVVSAVLYGWGKPADILSEHGHLIPDSLLLRQLSALKQEPFQAYNKIYTLDKPFLVCMLPSSWHKNSYNPGTKGCVSFPHLFVCWGNWFDKICVWPRQISGHYWPASVKYTDRDADLAGVRPHNLPQPHMLIMTITPCLLLFLFISCQLSQWILFFMPNLCSEPFMCGRRCFYFAHFWVKDIKLSSCRTVHRNLVLDVILGSMKGIQTKWVKVLSVIRQWTV